MLQPATDDHSPSKVPQLDTLVSDRPPLCGGLRKRQVFYQWLCLQIQCQVFEQLQSRPSE